MMANSDYTFTQVLNGTGYFCEEYDTGFSQGVKDLQSYLRQIGYIEITANGRFGSETTTAVKNFQEESKLSQDGIAGQQTVQRLNVARQSPYYLMCGGARLTTAEWGRDNILAGNFDDLDLLSRIIYAEHTTNTTDQDGVALVIHNRAYSGSTEYMESASDYPKASRFARVVGKRTAGYGTALETNTQAKRPLRGYSGNASTSYVDPAWKNAVDRALTLVEGKTISLTGYAVSGTTITSQRITVSTAKNAEYLNQISWTSYVSHCRSNEIDTSVTPITFQTTSGGNVICKIK